MVRESLAVVIVLLLAEAEGGEHDTIVGQGHQVVYPASGVSGKAEVSGNDGQHRWAITPIGVINGVKGVVMVRAPFQFLESSVTAKGNRVCYCADKGVLGGSCGEFCDVVEHAVRDYLLTFRYCLVLFNRIGH